MVAIDTSALLALVSTRDQYHERAVRTFEAHVRRGGRWVGSVLVLAELHGHLLRWRPPRTAHEIVEAVRRDPVYDWRAVDSDLIATVIERWLLPYADHRISLCDAITAQILSDERSDVVFGFDQHFVTMGLRLQEG